ncbi:glycoside hydrolase family 2 protein [Kineococcus esterisolvens]|uniref:glycoside hydrolase family 2 protein n=1 Tax=unclassified Kineococcus TaxID=2621656 RepID=UPI003D7E1097
MSTAGAEPPQDSLDEVELRRWRTALLAGDDAVEADLAVPPRPVSTVAADRALPGATAPEVSLDGEWLLAGTPPARQFSIDVWTGTAPRGPGAPAPVTWFREDTDRSAWVRATVPGTVQGALVAAGLMADPLTGSAVHDELVEHGQPREWPWHFRRTRVEQQEWWYARRFTVPENLRGRRLRLVFDGVDHEASVYLNGQLLRRHAGAYGGPDVDVTEALRGDGENELVVRVSPPPRDWHGVLKASPGWGWHYGHLIPVGIWRSVRLRAVPDVEPAHLFVRTTALDDGRARVRVEADLHAHTAARGAVPLQVLLRRPDGGVDQVRRAAVDLPAGLTRIAVDLDVHDPALWWPHGYGEQPLHRMELTVEGTTVETSFGIRTVSTEALPEWSSPEFYRWRFVVNGRPLFLKGANWCWTDPLAREPFDLDAHLLDLTVRANLQLLRAWGGGIVERDEFYDECDRLGVLVWQEFPLCFGLPDATGTDLRVLDDQVPRIVRRLRNHPCLLLWGGGNENPEPVAGDDPMLLVGRRVTQLDPSRPHHRTDPWGGSRHNYRVYHEGEPIDTGYRAVDAPVLGEYGLSSQCDLGSMRRFVPPELLDVWPPPPHGAILQHQAQFSLVDLVKQLRYADYGPVRGWEQMVEYSQLAQGEALRYASELVRAGSGTRTSAYVLYKVGEVFPGASWSIVDFYGVPKRSYYRIAQFSRAVCGFATPEHLEWPPGSVFTAAVHVANDTPHDARALRLTATVFDAHLRPVASRHAVLDVAADGREQPFDVRAEGVTADVFLLAVRLTGAGGELLSDQWYWFNAHPKNTSVQDLEARPVDDLWNEPTEPMFGAYAEDRRAPLLELPRTALRAELTRGELVVHNTGAVPAVNVLVDGFPHGPGAWLGDDSVGLLPGERRGIPVRLPGAWRGELLVRAWNADPVGAALRDGGL